MGPPQYGHRPHAAVVDKSEFIEGLKMLGFDADDAELHSLFNHFDLDGSGVHMRNATT